jgi:hypothetical protein
LAANGDKIFFEYTITYGGTQASYNVYFGGSKIDATDGSYLSFDGSTGAIIKGCVTRVSSSVVRCVLWNIGPDYVQYTYCFYGEITGLTLANTQILKLVAIADNGTVTARMGTVYYQAAA